MHLDIRIPGVKIKGKVCECRFQHHIVSYILFSPFQVGKAGVDAQFCRDD